MSSYKTITVDFKSWHDTMEPNVVQQALNEHAAQGWRLVNMIRGPVPRKLLGSLVEAEGVMITFVRD